MTAQGLGLEPQVQALYSALLSDPGASIEDLAEATGTTLGQVRSSLDALADRALVSGDGVAFRVTSPRQGYARLIAEAEAEIAERQLRLAEAKSALSALAAEHDASRHAGSILHLRSLEEVRTRLEELASQAELECVSLNPGRSHSADAMEASRPLNQQALDRGVTIRCIYQEAVRHDPPTHGYATWLTEAGGEARTLPVVPLLMVVVDRRVALVPAEPADPRAGALEIRSRGVVAALGALFDQAWLAARRLGDTTARDEGLPNDQELELIRLLAEGHTDQSAAARLGLSVRTVRRLMADLMIRLGARSRFEAGARAVTRGWL